jgi:hypothetical protein
VIVGQAQRSFRPVFSRVGEWLNHRSPTPVLVVHEEQPATTPPRGRRRAQVRTA